jgi:hypothetical protein
MPRRFLVFGLVVSSLVVAAAVAVIFALGARVGGNGHPAAEALPPANTINGGQEYWSEIKGYSIHIPEGWSTAPASIELDLTSTDVFINADDTGTGIAPTLSITKETLAAGTDLDEYLRNAVDYLGAGPEGVSKPEPLDVAGMRGYLVDYDGFSRQKPVQLTAAVLVKEGTGWEIVLAVPDGKRSEYRPLLASVLGSLKIP